MQTQKRHGLVRASVERMPDLGWNHDKVIESDALAAPVQHRRAAPIDDEDEAGGAPMPMGVGTAARWDDDVRGVDVAEQSGREALDIPRPVVKGRSALFVHSVEVKDARAQVSRFHCHPTPCCVEKTTTKG